MSIVAVTFGLARYSFGLFLPDIRADFALSLQSIGMIAGGSYIGCLAATLAGAWLSTLSGPRLPILLGGLSAAIGMAMIAAAPTAFVLACGVFIAGSSPGFAYPPYADVIARHVAPDRRDIVYAWINSGTGFGVAVAGPPALWNGTDWRLAWLAFAGLALVVTV